MYDVRPSKVTFMKGKPLEGILSETTGLSRVEHPCQIEGHRSCNHAKSKLKSFSLLLTVQRKGHSIKMYGLLLENMKAFICEAFGEKKWNEVKDALKLKEEVFGLKETFPEGQLIKMGKKAQTILNCPEEEFYEGMGIYFVGLTEKIGYFQYIEKLGRELRDFFLNLDNLHDYLKFIFPRLKPPSFFIEEETETSMKLQYRSKRRGFHYYVQGQTKEVAKKLFGLKVQMKFQKQEVVFDTVVCTFTLEFDNSAFARSRDAKLASKEVKFL